MLLICSLDHYNWGGSVVHTHEYCCCYFLPLLFEVTGNGGVSCSLTAAVKRRLQALGTDTIKQISDKMIRSRLAPMAIGGLGLGAGVEVGDVGFGQLLLELGEKCLVLLVEELRLLPQSLVLLHYVAVLQVVYSDVYMLDEGQKWKQLPPMPKPNFHIEFAWQIVNNSIIIDEGTTEKHLVSERIILVRIRFEFDARKSWMLSSTTRNLMCYVINLVLKEIEY